MRTSPHACLTQKMRIDGYSVCEVAIAPEYTNFINIKLIKPEEDSIRFYFLCTGCQGKVERSGGEQLRDNSIFFA
jgi:CRISPR-associated protein Cas2